MYTATARAKFVDQTVETASPAKQLTMLYDRLVLDLARAEVAQRHGERGAANGHLQHAQDIVTELLASLRLDAWEGAPRLASFYTYLLTQLVEANVTGDATKTMQCRELVEPLREAWHSAAQSVAAATPSLVGQLA
jgi:flagellar protein FliS